MFEVRISTRCYPTEDRSSVVGAITALFPDADVTGDTELLGIAHSLDEFGEQLKRQRIRDAARAVMRRGIARESISFRLNKQVAAVGRISFSDEDRPLGDIEVVIHTDDVDAVIDKLVPRTGAEVLR